MTDNIAIKVENLTKIYKLYDSPADRLKEALHWRGKKYHKDFYALNDINFEIKKGDCFGILGNNGAGKSTLLKIITGVLSATDGNVISNGKISALLELGAGFNPEYTGIENIYFQGNLMGYAREEVDTKLDSITQFADIGDFIHQPVKMYSSGMFARLAFAVAINVEPDILIVDEALSVGDMAFQNKCMQKMKSLMSERLCTVIFVSHSLSAIRLLCNKVVWIKNGKVAEIGNVDIVTDHYEYEMMNHHNVDELYKNALGKISEKMRLEEGGNVFDVSSVGEMDSSCGAYFNRISINNSNSKSAADFFKTFQDIEITLEIFSVLELSVSIGLAVNKADNFFEISRINNIRDEKSILLNSGKNIITLTLNNISLLTGSYYFSFYLAHDDLLRTIHKLENYIKVDIKTDFSLSGWRKYDGIVALAHTWEIK